MRTPLLPLWLILLALTPAPLFAQFDEGDPLDELFGEKLEGEQEALPEDPFERCVALLAVGRHDEAEAGLKRLIAEDAEDPEPLGVLARLYLKTGRDAEALAAASRQLELDPKAGEGWVARGRVAERQGKLAEAQRHYGRAIELGGRPHAIEALVRRAELLSEVDAKLAQRDLEAALAYYQRNDDLSAAEFTWIGRACRRIDVFPQLKQQYSRNFVKYARRMLDQALAADANYAMAHREGGLLSLLKFNHPDAKKSYELVIERDKNDPDARVGRARARLASFYGGAGKYKDAADDLKKALSANPHHAGAHATLAGIAILDGDFEAALERIETGLKHRPADVELLAAQAAVQLLRGYQAGFQQIEQQVLKLRPRCARFFEAVAETVQMKFRYAEARDLAKRALEVDPGYHPVLAILGVNLTRTGQEEEGRKVLQRAFEEDPFNVFVFNHLQLWDRLDEHYTTVEMKGAKLRISKEELLVSTRYVKDLVNECRERLGGRYEAVPEQVLIELFPKHADFSARSVGLPGIPALGVCFGKVVTVLSAKEKKAVGAHSWGRTLWHEYAHVCTLTRSKNRVPRWLTEGISVYEEPKGRKTWVRGSDGDILMLMDRGLIMPVARLDEGFTKPRYPNQVMMSYYQGGAMCEFIEARWGFEKILGLLDAYGEGLDTKQAIQKVFGFDHADFDRRFMRFLQRRYRHVAWRPPPAPERRRELLSHLGRSPLDVAARGELAWVYAVYGKDVDAAAQAGLALEHAEKLAPELGQLELGALPGGEARAALRAANLRAGAADAHLALGVVAGRKGKLSRAARRLRRALDLGTRDPVLAHKLLSKIHAARKQWKQAIEELRTVERLSPPNAELQRQFAELWKKAGDEAESMAALKQACLLDSDDAKVRVTFATWAAKQGRWVEVLEVLDDVNLIDPFRKDTHLLLGDALRKTALGDEAKLKRALGEYEVAEILKVDYLAGAYFGKAACLAELGKREEALEAVRKALGDDPEHAEARALKTKLEGK